MRIQGTGSNDGPKLEESVVDSTQRIERAAYKKLRIETKRSRYRQVGFLYLTYFFLTNVIQQLQCLLLRGRRRRRRNSWMVQNYWVQWKSWFSLVRSTMFRPMWTIHNFFTILTFEQPTVMPTTLHFKFRHYLVFFFQVLTVTKFSTDRSKFS